jgi:hypothetical protein
MHTTKHARIATTTSEFVLNMQNKQLGSSGKKRQEEELANFLKKRENGELLIQKTARLFEHFLAPVQRQPLVERTFLAFGQTVQLIACDMPAILPGGQPLTLSVVVNEPHIDGCQAIDRHCELSCAPSSELVARNAFVIRQVQPHDAHLAAAVEHLKYGQDFALECHGSRRPLLVYSTPKNPLASHNVAFKVHGEMKQSVGLALQRANDGVKPTTSAALIDESIPTAFFRWRFHHTNPELRYETIGEKIPVRIGSRP